MTLGEKCRSFCGKVREFFGREKVKEGLRVALVVVTVVAFLAAVALSAYSIYAFAPLKAVVDLDAEMQTMTGFGASSAWIYQSLGREGNEEAASRAVEMLYGDSGLALNIFRYNIGGGSADAALDGVWPYNGEEFDVNRRAESFFVAENYTEPADFYDESNYDFERDAAVRGLFAEALSKGNITKVVFFANSPHYLMTESGVCIGKEEYVNNLRPEFYEEFSAYLLIIVDALYETYLKDLPVVPTVYISPANEPQWKWGGEGASQEGCHYDAEVLARFYAVFWDALGAYNAEHGTDFRLDAFESGCYEFRHSGDNIDDYLEEMSKYAYFDSLDEISVHTYHADTSKAIRRKFAAFLDENYPDLTVAATEFCEMQWGEFDTIKSGIFLAQAVLRDITMIDAALWCWWLSVAVGGYNDGLVYWDEDGTRDEEIWVLKRYYTFGQITRFVDEGDVRVGCTTSDPLGWAGLDIAAFRKPDGRVVIVVVNDGLAKDLRLDGMDIFSGTTVQVTVTTQDKNWAESALVFDGELPLEKKSVTTFVFG